MGSRIANKQDISTRNDQMDYDIFDNDRMESKAGEPFSRTVKEKSQHYKVPPRKNSVNQTPKLVGVSKLVKFQA